MTRVNVLLMNRGNGPGFPPCPRAKSAPLPEYSTVFNRSAPIARDAFVMTVLASCAAALHCHHREEHDGHHTASDHVRLHESSATNALFTMTYTREAYQLPNPQLRYACSNSTFGSWGRHQIGSWESTFSLLSASGVATANALIRRIRPHADRSPQVRDRGQARPVQPRHLADIELQPLNVVVQVHAEWRLVVTPAQSA